MHLHDRAGTLTSPIINGETNSCAKDKARILSNQFKSAFANKDFLIMTSDATPQICSISFSAHGFNYF